MGPASRLLAAVAVVAVACGPSEATVRPPATSPATDPVPVVAEVPALHPSVDSWEAGTVEVVVADDTRHRVAVRVARSPQQRAHGLMEVDALPDGAGMWFVYAQASTGGFWMKDTEVALDIAYVDAADRIVSVAHAEPCETDPCPTYPPAGAYRGVLEVPAGFLDRVGAGVGDAVRLVAP